MDRKKDNQSEEGIILLNRLIERKNLILSTTQEIEDLRNEYIAKGEKDPDGSIEARLYKHLYTIVSCLSEITINAALHGVRYQLVPKMVEFVSNYPRGFNEPLPLIKTKSLTAFCLAANSVPIMWISKKGPFLKIENLDSLIKMFSINP
jgi:hypothetical protein